MVAPDVLSPQGIGALGPDLSTFFTVAGANTAHKATYALRASERERFGAAGRAHKATSRPMRAVEAAQRRVVHGGGRSALATNRPSAAVGNPCLTRWRWCCAVLTFDSRTTEGIDRLPCPCGDCPVRLPFDGPSETRSPQGAGRPRRAPRCSARPCKLERLFMSFPPRLPTRTVIPQLPGACL